MPGRGVHADAANPYGSSVEADPAEEGGAQSGAPGSVSPPRRPVPLPADLGRVVAVWPHLPAAVRAGVLAMVDASAPAEEG